VRWRRSELGNTQKRGVLSNTSSTGRNTNPNDSQLIYDLFRHYNCVLRLAEEKVKYEFSHCVHIFNSLFSYAITLLSFCESVEINTVVVEQTFFRSILVSMRELTSSVDWPWSATPKQTVPCVNAGLFHAHATEHVDSIANIHAFAAKYASGISVDVKGLYSVC